MYPRRYPLGRAQLAYAVSAMAPFEERKARERQIALAGTRKGDLDAGRHQGEDVGRTYEKLAEKAGVGARTVICAQKSRSDADAFFAKLATGDGIPRTSPIYLLRQKLISDMIGKTYEPNYRLFCYLIKTWNTWRKGNHPKGVTYMRPRDGEAFPEIEQ